MEIKQNTIALNNLKVHYKTAGDSKKKPLVFLHGWPMRITGYPDYSQDPVIEALANIFML